MSNSSSSNSDGQMSYYEGIFADYEHAYTKNVVWDILFYQALLKKLTLDKSQSQRILDVGCGFGRFSLFLARDQRYQITAIDKSHSFTEMLKHEVSQQKTQNIHVLHGDVFDLHDEVYDYVLMPFMIVNAFLTENELVRFFSHLLELLSQDGRLIFTINTEEYVTDQVISSLGEKITSMYMDQSGSEQKVYFINSLHNQVLKQSFYLDEGCTLHMIDNFTRLWDEKTIRFLQNALGLSMKMFVHANTENYFATIVASKVKHATQIP